MRTLLIEDIPANLALLRNQLTEYCKDDVEVIGEAASATEALEKIYKLKPELIISDIMLGEENIFPVLEKISHFSFRVIFVTAFEQFAIKAIKCSALDYLLKPVEGTELKKAVLKAKNPAGQNQHDLIENFLKIMRRPATTPPTIAIPDQRGFVMIPVEEIIYCHAEAEYTKFFFNARKPVISSLNLGEYEFMLSDYDFLRVHHSYLVNRRYVERYSKGDTGELTIAGNNMVPISRRKKQQVLEWLTKPGGSVQIS